MTFTWQVIRVGVTCAFGCQVRRGDAAAFGRSRPGRGPFILCRVCARRRYGLAMPRGIRQREAARERERANASDGKLRQLPPSERA